MDDFYELLQVSPSADADVITAAYRRLSQRTHPDASDSVDADVAQRRLNHAFEVLSDPARRADYDRSRATGPVPEQGSAVVAQTAAAPARPPGKGLVVALSAVAGLGVFAILVATVVVALRDRDSQDYHADKGDGDYRLNEMALTQDDLPVGFQQIPGTEFTNEEWAAVFGSDDPEAKQRQLEAQGWLKNYVTESVPERFGKVLNVRSISTLYTNVKAAEESTSKFACGLPIDTAEPIDEFIVPKIADQSNGFFFEQEIDEDGTTLMYTTVCFRTGRIVHVVQEAAVPGLEDIGSSLRTARLMLAHVDDSFGGKAPPPTEEEEDEEEG